jgi:hypothetical protein
VMKKVPYTTQSQVPVTITKMVPETVHQKVPFTVTRKVNEVVKKQVPYTVQRSVCGAYVDQAELAGYPVGGSGVVQGHPNAGNLNGHAEPAPGRVFVEGAKYARTQNFTTVRHVTETLKKTVPYTVTKTVAEEQTKQVPYTVTKMVPTSRTV